MKSALGKILAAAICAGSVAGCGKHEAPAPAASGPAPASASGSVPAPSVSAFTMAADTPAGGNCALDAINGGPVADVRIATNTDVTFAGWMGDSQGQVPSGASFVLKGAEKSYSVPVSGGGARPDVVKVLGSEGLARSGYHLTARLGNVAPGTYELMIVHGALKAVCPLNVRLTITP